MTLLKISNKYLYFLELIKNRLNKIKNITTTNFHWIVYRLFLLTQLFHRFFLCNAIISLYFYDESFLSNNQKKILINFN